MSSGFSFPYLGPPATTVAVRSARSLEREKALKAKAEERALLVQKGLRKEWMNNTVNEIFEEFHLRLQNINKEYIKRLLLSMTMYCDTTHPKKRVPHALFDRNEPCSVFNIKGKLREFLSNAPKGYLMLTGPEVIGLTFGPEAQEQYETLLGPYEGKDDDEDEEAGHGVDEDYDVYAGHGVNDEEPPELTSMEEVDGGKRRKTKRRRSMKRKNKTKKSKKTRRTRKSKSKKMKQRRRR
jgi:hypothetical protein